LVEDEFLLLSELEEVLHDAGAGAVRACRTLAEATAVLDKCEFSAAILDVRIGGDTIAPVARQLARRGTPFIFYTGQVRGDRNMVEWPDRPILSKPATASGIVTALTELLKH
jgi:DNA-binding NtrC family response regulator